MTFKEACNTEMTKGIKFKGQTIEEIGASEEGLLWLDWCQDRKWIRGKLKEAVVTYLGDPSVNRKVVDLVAQMD